MPFIWNDGGRAASGYIGQTGDCVTRSIAIATGLAYREVYRQLSVASDKTARHGVCDAVSSRFLSERGWTNVPVVHATFEDLPRGVTIVSFRSDDRRHSGHLTCVIDHTIYDTWNPFDDPDYHVIGYWIHPSNDSESTSPIRATARQTESEPDALTQEQFDKILHRVKALHRTASNRASTEGEIRNAMRMMQSLMLKHNLSRSDIVDDDDVRHVGMTRQACPLSGARCCQWESRLAYYMTEHVFPTVQFYQDRYKRRTRFWFYGPVADVRQTIELFREMLITIATAARLKYGGYARGSGASYAEGYVKGLPRECNPDSSADENAVLSQNALIHARMVAIRSAAEQWLWDECGIKLQSTGGSGRSNFDGAAHAAGRRDGAKHDVRASSGQTRIGVRG